MMKRVCSTLCVLMGVQVATAEASCLQSDANLASCRTAAEQCIQLSDGDARLACYDKLFAAQAAISTTAVDPAMPAAAVAAVDPAAEAQAKIEAAFPPPNTKSDKHGADEEPPVLRSSVVKFKQDPYKKHYLVLENGHIWREKERSRFRYKAGTQIRVEKGALGANYLYVEGQSGMVLVERYK